jgi:hypothetical protein
MDTLAKIVPFSIVLMSVVVPALMAAKPRAKPAFRTMFTVVGIYVVVWGYLCLYFYTSYVHREAPPPP